MKDPLVPNFVVKTQQQIDLTFSVIPNTIPQFSNENTADAPTDIVASPTQTQVADQGYTYNQAGFTYNEVGVMYGGIYNQNQDLAPVFSNDTALLLNPSISSIIDITSPFVPPVGNSGQLMGILGLTYP